MEVSFIAIRALSILFLVSLILPLIKNDHWTFRVFEFPRLQKFVICVTLLLLSLWMVYEESYFYDWALVFLLLIGLIYLAHQILPFTILAKKQVNSATDKSQKADIAILINNVYQYNREFGRLIKLVHQYKADVVMLVETDISWKEACIKGFGKDYPYQILNELDNTYGMLLFSKFSLENAEVRKLIKEGIPSIKVDIVVKPGKKVTFFGLHPEPPVPSENPYATDRDAEILLVAKEIQEVSGPVLVAGDLNDVAWSHTTELFLKTSGLLDPRRGRGFFNTFHAKYKLLRWPLDHLFCSKHFCIHTIKRLPATGSDHFPIYITLQLEANENIGHSLEADEADEKEVNEKIRAAI